MLCDPVFETQMQVVLVIFLVLTVGLPHTNTRITFSGFTSKRTVTLFCIKKNQRTDGKRNYYALKEYT